MPLLLVLITLSQILSGGKVHVSPSEEMIFALPSFRNLISPKPVGPYRLRSSVLSGIVSSPFYSVDLVNLLSDHLARFCIRLFRLSLCSTSTTLVAMLIWDAIRNSVSRSVIWVSASSLYLILSSGTSTQTRRQDAGTNCTSKPLYCVPSGLSDCTSK